ncbi:MAG: HAD-IIB family hydrolase, partial [Pseudomonadales bacterium]
MTACALATLGNRALQALREQRAAQGLRIKLIFFDVDGTLVNTHREVPHSAISSIERIRALKIKTAIASGRPPFACEHLFRELNIEDAGMFFTGALLYDPAGDSIIEANPLPGLLAKKFVDAARHYDLHLELYSDTTYFIEQHTA